MAIRRTIASSAGIIVPLVALAALLASCGRGYTSSAVDRDLAASLSPTYSAIQSAVFNRRCVGCHKSIWAMEKLKLSEGVSYDAMVGVLSRQKPDLRLVDPGKPDSSYLVMKLEGSEGIDGARMPPPERDPVEPEAIEAIREWIAGGAPR